MTDTTDDTARDDEVLRRRAAGATYGRIARDLGFSRASQANAAFNRAMRRRPPPEHHEIRDGEFARLNELELRVRRDASVGDADRDRRLGVIDRLRDRLLAN